MERELHRILKAQELTGKLYAGVWLDFIDANGPGFAQPDFFLLRPKEILIFESKLTETTQADIQLQKLYKPLLEKLLNRPALCIQVCRNVRTRAPSFKVSHPREVLEYPRPETHLWHLVR